MGLFSAPSAPPPPPPLPAANPPTFGNPSAVGALTNRDTVPWGGTPFGYGQRNITTVTPAATAQDALTAGSVGSPGSGAGGVGAPAGAANAIARV